MAIDRKILGASTSYYWRKNAKYFYEKRHRVTLDFFVDNFHEFIDNYEFIETNSENSKIISSLWWQGYENASKIVKCCLDNMKTMAQDNGFEFFCLD